jgi:NET1-associated nuclear protein 1 (U3 small nucleolar RNA-associated protein 17)
VFGFEPSNPLSVHRAHVGVRSYFFSVVGSSIKIYSAVTGEIVSTLSSAHPYRVDPKTMPPNWEPPSSSDLITSAVLNPHNPFQLITSSLNGCIMVWDFLDAILLQVVDLQQPITHLSAHDKFKDSVFVGANKVKNQSAVTG